MVWMPAFTIITARAIAENLLTYFEANQADALAWANGGTALRPFQRIENSVGNRNSPVFPAIMFADDNTETDYAGSYPIGGYAVTFEVMIQNADPNNAVIEARKYEKALLSMVRNCPQATFTANTGALASASTLRTVETGFDEVRANDRQNDFMQMFSMRITYELHAAAI